MARLFLFIFSLQGFWCFGQLPCDLVRYSKDSLFIYRNTLYTGQCISESRTGLIREYISRGRLDSARLHDRKNKCHTVERYCGESTNIRIFYKNGILKRSFNLKNDRYAGYWREYYRNGAIKYEAEYSDSSTIKNDTYYTWDNRGVKYQHTKIEKEKTKSVGNLRMDVGYTRTKKTRVKISS